MLGVLSALLALALTSCAGWGPLNSPLFRFTSDQAESPSVIPQPAQIMSLVGRFGFAHACPTEGRVYTAAHVAATVPRGTRKQFPSSYAWQQGDREGLVTASRYPAPSQFADVAFLDVVTGKPEMMLRAAEVNVGERVYWYEYNFSNKDEMLDLVLRESVLTKLVAGHFVTEDSFTQGASGGCVFNDRGEVIGIISFRLRVMNQARTKAEISSGLSRSGEQWVGVGVLLSDGWCW